jgi:hypothetical protein
MVTDHQLPAEILKLALKDVTGEDCDVTSAEGQAQVAEKVRALLDSDRPDFASALARSVINRASPGEFKSASLPRVAYRLVHDEHGRDISDDELPSRAVRAPVLVITEGDVVSPKWFGWESVEVVDWTVQLKKRWVKFIEAAHSKIPSDQQVYVIRMIKSLYRDTPLFETEHRAKNYDLVTLRSGKEKTTTHFVFGSKHVYFVVYDMEDSETYRAKVALDDVSRFSNEIAHVYRDRPELAKSALTHLLSALTH